MKKITLILKKIKYLNLISLYLSKLMINIKVIIKIMFQDI